MPICASNQANTIFLPSVLSSCLYRFFDWIQFKLHVRSTSNFSLFIVVVIQLENFIGDEFEKRTTEFVIPCLCQLALSSKESGLPKELNYQICLQTRSSKAKVRRESTPWSVHDCVILKDVYEIDVRRTICLQLLSASHSLVRHQFHVHFHMHVARVGQLPMPQQQCGTFVT